MANPPDGPVEMMLSRRCFSHIGFRLALAEALAVVFGDTVKVNLKPGGRHKTIRTKTLP
jgi:hypothetical protein